MKKNRWLIMVAACMATAIVLWLLVVHGVKSTIHHNEQQAFDDSDLILKHVEVPVGSNAFSILLEATNKLYWPRSSESKFHDLIITTNWDDSLATEVLDKNRICLDLFDQAMHKPFLQIPEPVSFAEEFPYLQGWRNISRVAAIQCRALFRKRQQADAFNEAFEIIRFGQRAEGSGGAFLHYLVGGSIKEVGLVQVREMTAQTTLPASTLARFIRELDNFKPNQAGLTNAVKVEYQTVCRMLDDLAAGKIPSTTNSAFERTLISFGSNPLFNAKETKMKFARLDCSFLGAFSKPYGEIDWSFLPVAETNTSFLSGLKLAIKGNAIGNIFYEMLGPSLKPIVKGKIREDVNVTATQLLLALKLYKMRYGELPASLSQLVPEELSQIPMDDFDGKPFRYARDKKLIYSVGPDLKDDGGIGYHKHSKSYDLPFKIDF